jgi:tetratricopeptide (TPR) repeat protein
MLKLETEEDIDSFFHAQLVASKKAEKLNNQKPQKAPKKDYFTLYFQSCQLVHNMSQSDGGSRTTIITGKRNYCKKNVDELKPMMLDDMMVPKVHFGRYLLCRTVTAPACLNAIYVVIQDENGDVEDLSLYNMTSNLKANLNEILPIGTILLIKEPYMKYGSADVTSIIRCDSPSDVIFLDESSELLRGSKWFKKCEGKENYSRLKDEGNQHFYKNKFESALRCYKKAMNIESNEIIYLNISAAMLKLERYEEAYDYANKSFELVNTDKALYRMASSAYNMRNWKLALEKYELIKDKSIINNNEIEQCLMRLEEEKTGNYNWFNILKQREDNPYSKIDVADYHGPIEVKDIENKGKGYIATRDIKRGELLMVSKAFSISFMNEIDGSILLANLITKKGGKNTDALNITKTVDNLKKNPRLTQQLYSLYSGQVDRNVKIRNGFIDVGRIEHIHSFNAFCQPKNYSNINPNTEDLLEKISTGLWLLPSFFNHSCCNNAKFEIYGDIMVIRARRDIKKDEEIALAYIHPLYSFEKRKIFFDHFNFKCECNLCSFEKSDKQYKYRHELIDRKCGMINKHLTTNRTKCLKWALELVKELKQIQYPSNNYHLYRPLMRLTEAYIENKEFNKAIDILEEICSLFGEYADDIKSLSLMKMASIYKSMNKMKEAKKAMERAIENCKDLYDDSKDCFKLRFKNLYQLFNIEELI